MVLGSFFDVLMTSCKGCITHQPLTCCDPIDEGDHKVDVGNVFKVTGHEVESVVDAPHRMNIGSNPPGRAIILVDRFHNFIGFPEYRPIMFLAP